MAEHSFTTTIIWHRIVRPDGAYVREEGAGNPIVFGPMPEETMLPFIAERKAVHQSIFNKQTEHLRHIADLETRLFFAEKSAEGKPGFFSKNGSVLSIY